MRKESKTGVKKTKKVEKIRGGKKKNLKKIEKKWWTKKVVVEKFTKIEKKMVGTYLQTTYIYF